MFWATDEPGKSCKWEKYLGPFGFATVPSELKCKRKAGR